MPKDSLADFLHLFHALWPRRETLARLLDRFGGDPRAARSADAVALSAAGLDSDAIACLRRPQQARVERDLDWAARPGHRLVRSDDAAYPVLLREIPDYPLLLYALGDAELLRQPQIAIVGSRNCTPGGAQIAFDFATELAAAGFAITSGLALGIDGQAHRGALSAAGRTLAVMATGPDRVYPSRHRGLAREIETAGLLVTEFPPGCNAARHHFPRRNRIISGLALATVVVEAAARSGSLITARLAAEQGREVFAVPGSVRNPLTRGCHGLICDGARLAQTPADVVEGLGPLLGIACAGAGAPAARPAAKLDATQRRLLEAIGYDPVDCDLLVQRTGLTIGEVSSMLSLLELNDLIRSAPGGCFVRI